MDKKMVSRWVDQYIQAWSSNDPQVIGDLFAADAVYYTAPFREPWRSREGIVQSWLERKDEPGTWEFAYEVLSACEDLGVVKGRTKYLSPSSEFSNLWTVRLDDQGRCREFTEWWMEVK